MTQSDDSNDSAAASAAEQWQWHDPEFRFAVRACVFGLVLAYALVFPLKAGGFMPAHMSWLGLLLAPAAMFGAFGSIFAGALWFRQRWWLLVLPVFVLAWVVMLTLNLVRIVS